MLPTHLEDYLEYITKLSLKNQKTKINIIYFYYLLINNNI